MQRRRFATTTYRRWLATTALLVPAAASAGTPAWTISEAAGPVTILHAGVSRVAMRSGTVGPGDIVRTGPNGRAVIARGQEYVLVAPASQVRLPAVEQKGAIAQMVQDAGDVVFMIRKMATPHFAVQTPYLAAVVKGTTFSVSVGEGGARVKVLEGAVDVATPDGGAHELLRPGGTIAVDASRLTALRVTMGGVDHFVRSKDDKGPATPAAPTTRSRPAPAPAAATPAIAAPVAEPTVSLARLTGGLVSDDAVVVPAVVPASTVLPGAAANVGIAGSATPQATLAVAHASNAEAVVAVNNAMAHELVIERATALANQRAADAAA
ncbi:FecR family protein, partial [Sphingomonas sp. GC_Shp_2]